MLSFAQMQPANDFRGASMAPPNREQHQHQSPPMQSPPPPPPDSGSMIAKDLTKITHTERTRAMEDIHGVADPYEENDAKMKQLLQRMDEAIEAIREKPAYQRAFEMSPAFVQDAEFRTMFLRADGLNPQRAAMRLTQFFEHKRQLFGENKLVQKTITMQDLNEDDLSVLYGGQYQISKQKDQVGRVVFCTLIDNKNAQQSRPSRRSVMRVIYYLTMVMVQQDENVQKQGLVGVVYSMAPEGATPSFDAETVSAASLLRNALPARYAAIHYCFNHDSFHRYVNCDRAALDRDTRPRCCVHQSSQMEVQFELHRYGIKSKTIPISMIGNKIKLENHNEWLATQKFQELMDNDPSGELFSGFGDDDDVEEDVQRMQMNWAIQPTPFAAPAAPTIPCDDVLLTDLQCMPQPLASVPANDFAPSMSKQTTQQFFGDMNCFSGTSDSNFIPMSSADVAAAVFANNRVIPATPSVTSTPFAMQTPHFQPCTGPSVYGPTKNDVLFGRGKVKEHPGNVYLHQLLGEKQDRYEAAERWEKTVIAEEIVSIIRERGGRFLKQGKSQQWVEVDAETAREKVSHTFRSRRLKGTATTPKSTLARRNQQQKSKLIPDD